MEHCLEKVRQLRKIKPDIDIEVDGGINDKTAPLAVRAGANILVVSSFVFKSEDKIGAIKKLKSCIENIK